MKKLLLLTVVFVFAVSAAHAASVSATGTADAEIVAPISIEETTPLNFGRWSSPTDASTVSVSAAASPTVGHTGSIQQVGGGTAASAAAFAVTNDGSLPYGAAVSDSSITISDGNSHTMTVNGFSLSCTSSCTAATLYVGGTLNVGAGQAAGSYTGSFTVTLTY